MHTAPISMISFRTNAGNLVRTSTLTTLLACSVPVLAQQPPGEGKPGGPSWGIGLGVISMQKAYAGISRDNKVLPMLTYESKYLKLSGPNLDFKLPGLQLSESQHLNFGLTYKFFGGGVGYEASDSPALEGMEERKAGRWAGAKMEWKNDLADVNLEWLTDAASASKGQRVNLSVGHKWMLGRSFMLAPSIGAEWVDNKYVDYYYGVRSNEATAGRAAYLGTATVNTEISLMAMYRLDKEQSLMLSIGVKSLGKEIKDSPIVDRSTENRVMLGYTYRFQ
jgi:outer membrane protein